MNRVGNLFLLRSEEDKKAERILEVFGFGLLFCLWWMIASLYPNVLPTPLEMVLSVKKAFLSGTAKESFHILDSYLIKNIWFSVKINCLGYLLAIAIAIPFGILIGSFTFFRAMCSRMLDAIRFLPFNAIMGMFIAWFGIYMKMKIIFLAGAILVYLLPVVVQRVLEVPEVYFQTAKTLGATQWQTLKKFAIPDVLGRVFEDIRVLVAISWTYIIIAESINMGEGGVGAIISQAVRQSNMGLHFSMLGIIIGIGVLQDKSFIFLDRILFPYKYAGKPQKSFIKVIQGYFVKEPAHATV